MDGGTILNVALFTTAVGGLAGQIWQRSLLKSERFYRKAADARVAGLTADLGARNASILNLNVLIDERDATIERLAPLAEIGRKRQKFGTARNERRKDERAVARAERELAKNAKPVGQLAAKRPVKRRAAKK